MLFDLHPKERREELFGREREIEYSVNQLLSKNWILIGGQREMGKTSLMKVVINELRKEHGFKGIYINLRGVRNLNSLLEMMLSEISNTKIELNVRINFMIGSAGVKVKKGAKVVNSLIELLNSIEDNFVIGLDEVQELSQASKYFLDVLGNVFTSNEKVRFIFTGSYIGVTRSLIDPPSLSPLHGRPPVVLNLRRFREEESASFLKRGMEELNLDFNREDQVVKRLDGVVGWLTLFGNLHAVRGMSFEDALNSTVAEGSKIMVDEFKHFLENKGNKALYVKLMEIVKVVSRWSEIKRGIEISLGNIDDKELTLALDSLVNNNFMEKGDKGEYKIVDPLLREIDFGRIWLPT
ncbi:hypothetical protein IC006_0905 [Sulfuracidifex tepidarius]|uniref:Uncharacterized protein n=1 Tax=Sulfuracidifex tepidarius TaxID=1294262 RepID=A0A510DTX9_9CREN|nr:ATP-binding protein [Sulfuracidifex tepidarius]BBG23617.1 hypothetical protein IC006_0905 [Sulfuracidifex tepidarius]